MDNTNDSIKVFREMWDTGLKWATIEKKFGMSMYKLKKIAEQEGFPFPKPRPNQYVQELSLYEADYENQKKLKPKPPTANELKQMRDRPGYMGPTLKEIFEEEGVEL